MKLVIQRVKKAGVTNKETGEVTGKIENGLFILVGFSAESSKKIVDEQVQKLIKLRVFSDTSGKMNLSLKEAGGSFLVVSQFTLFADTSKGNRPSFIKAAKPEMARELYDYFVESLRQNEVVVETGSFGSYMEINAELDGPVTIII